MGATDAAADPPGEAEDDREAAERRLERYLRERAADGEFFFKSKFIAEDVGLSPSQIGTLVARLRDSVEGLEIEKWAYTNATTWRVAPEPRA